MKVFEIEDKNKKVIYLTKERWAHIQRHPSMLNKIDAIKEALQHPDKITPFEFDPNVRFFYKYHKSRKEYLFASVKYLNGEGFVITSFFTNKIK